MEWQADAVVLSARVHGETSAIVDLFTRDHGRQAGVVRGGAGRKMTPHLQPGNQVQAVWRARLEDHLGTLVIDPVTSRAARVMSDRVALAGMSSVCAVLLRALPDRQPLPAVYDATQTLLDALGLRDWALLYLHWELNLLAALGFGLDLTRCAVTDADSDLRWVSPRTGRAVSSAGAKGWEDRLLPLPACLITGAAPAPGELAQGLRLTGHFLNKGLSADPGARPLPEARTRFLGLLG